MQKQFYNKLNSNSKSIIALCFAIAFAFTLSGCKQEEEGKINSPKYSSTPTKQTIPVFHFTVCALYNPNRLVILFNPLIDYLNNHIDGAQIILEASGSFTNFENKYKARDPEFILPNPWETLQAIKSGYTVIASAGDPKDFKGLLIVRKDSGVLNPMDLKGKTVSFSWPTSLAACIMPQYYLQNHGLDINKEITNIYVGSPESSIMNVYLKNSIAGGAWPPAWRDFQKTHPNESSQMKVIWETESLINNSVMARNDVDINVKNQVSKCLLELDKTPEGKKILKGIEIAYFKLATNKDYNVVQTYTDQFEKEVRKIDIK